MQEIWKAIEKFNGFEVSNLGNVRMLDRPAYTCPPTMLAGRMLIPFTAKTGYQSVKLFGKVYSPIHTLVAAAFLVKSDPKHVVTHKDGDRSNNSADNLHYVTMGAALKAAWERRKERVETWRPIAGHPNHLISDLGRIKTLTHTVTPKSGGLFTIKESVRKPGMSKEGCQVIKLGGRYRRIHELVAAAFLSKQDPNHVIVHLNGNKEDNREANLCYMGRKEAYLYNTRPKERQSILRLVKTA